MTISPLKNSIDDSSSDVLVVGSGIVGLAHAILAVQAGLRVRLIERDHRPVGASIRNFGHVCVTAQHGHVYDLAQAARRHWLRLAEQAGIGVVESGSVVVATTLTQLQLLREFSAARPAGQVTLFDRAEVTAQLKLAADASIVGGAFLRDDLRVDPRTTVGRLNTWLAEHPLASVHNATAATSFETGTTRRHRVRTTRGDVEADQVFVCVGHDVDYLFPQVAEEHQMVRCALNMSSAKPSESVEVVPAVLTGTSMLRYDAFAQFPSYPRARDELLRGQPELIEIGANVMYTQRPDGTLLLGDSHSYAATQPPFLAQSTTATLHRELRRVLPNVSTEPGEQWQGIYASSDRGPLLIRDVAPGLTVVSVTSGIGMTIGFGLAEHTLSERLPSTMSANH